MEQETLPALRESWPFKKVRRISKAGVERVSYFEKFTQLSKMAYSDFLLTFFIFEDDVISDYFPDITCK